MNFLDRGTLRRRVHGCEMQRIGQEVGAFLAK